MQCAGLTPCRRDIRKALRSIDELPQFINVLQGRMIIGKTLAVVWRDQNAYQDARPRIVGGRRHKASPALFALRDRDTVSMLR